MNNAEAETDIETETSSTANGKAVGRTAVLSRRFVLLASLVTFLFIIALVPYLLYRNILHQNFREASLDSYPSPKKIIAKLHCPVKPNASITGNLEARRQPLFRLPLRTHRRNIVDARGERVKLMSTNWYGASDEDFVPGGLDVRHRREIAATIRDMGFNSVRLPYSDEMVMTNPDVPMKFWSQNADLLNETARRRSHRRTNERGQRTRSPLSGDQVDTDEEGNRQPNSRTAQPVYIDGKNDTSNIIVKALDVFDAVITALTDEGIAVIVNDHITQARWCCDANLCDATWSNDYLGKVCRIRQTEEQWIQNWEHVMRPHIDNPLVIGADLRNENRSPLGKMLWATWAAAAEKAANRLHALQPNWLMFVEGVASGNYLQGVRSHPVNPTVANRVVYSAHIYGWSGWGSLLKGPYWSRDFASFSYDMFDNWGFLLAEDIAPVWVGEFGAPDRPNTGDLNYWVNLMSFLDEVDADWGYWALNPRKPSGNETESYSLLRDDWVTPTCDYRMYDMLAKLGLRPYNSTWPLPETTSTAAPTRTARPVAPADGKQVPLGHL
ncbi:Endoglucanase [Drechslerella dactyloides]|uniref:Endoglucanase n=1 Tax=Drechslerella dactyloides TaxID=74499 RepID=A0AAD6NJY9_DREDA|nr:Endoglucanase [Drechslerella dactyloides]